MILGLPAATQTITRESLVASWRTTLWDIVNPHKPDVIGVVPNPLKFGAMTGGRSTEYIRRYLSLEDLHNGNLPAFGEAQEEVTSILKPSLAHIATHHAKKFPDAAMHEFYVESDYHPAVPPLENQRAVGECQIHIDELSLILKETFDSQKSLQPRIARYFVSSALPTGFYCGGVDLARVQELHTDLVAEFGINGDDETVRRRTGKAHNSLLGNFSDPAFLWHPQPFEIVAAHPIQPHFAVPNPTNRPIPRHLLRVVAWQRSPHQGLLALGVPT